MKQPVGAQAIILLLKLSMTFSIWPPTHDVIFIMKAIIDIELDIWPV